MEPVNGLIGSSLIGAGVLLLFGALKNKRVFGSDGILSLALSTGSIVKSSSVPNAFDTPDRSDPGVEKGVGQITPVQMAVTRIREKDAVLANQIQARLDTLYGGTTRDELTPLAQLLAVADGKGLSSSTSVIRAHVLEVTGESI